MVEWIIWYADGTTFSSDEGGPEQAPKEGVIVVGVRDQQVGRRLLHSGDYFCWQHDNLGAQNSEWVVHNSDGLKYYLSRPFEVGIYIIGYNLTGLKWQMIYADAMGDKRLPDKTGWDWREAESLAPEAYRRMLEKKFLRM